MLKHAAAFGPHAYFTCFSLLLKVAYVRMFFVFLMDFFSGACALPRTCIWETGQNQEGDGRTFCQSHSKCVSLISWLLVQQVDECFTIFSCSVYLLLFTSRQAASCLRHRNSKMLDFIFFTMFFKDAALTHSMSLRSPSACSTDPSSLPSSATCCLVTGGSADHSSHSC